VFQVIENQVAMGCNCIIKISQHVAVYLRMLYQVELTQQYCLHMPRILRSFL
jgi:hypothetical protein